MLTPARSETAALQILTVHAYSDLLTHHMGKRLADDITQGLATGDMFRSTPLWGVGQRRFFLHDGRAGGFLSAIDAHSSPPTDCDDNPREDDEPPAPSSRYGPSEAQSATPPLHAVPPAHPPATD